jgi:hypothetical protein
MEGATKVLSQYKLNQYDGRRRTKSDAYLLAGKVTALVTVAAFTVAAGSAGAASTLSHPNISHPNISHPNISHPNISHPNIVARSATNTGSPASLFRNTGPFTSRSEDRVGLPPKKLVEVTPTASVLAGFGVPDTWQRQQDLLVARAAATAEAARVAKAVKAVKAAAAKASKATKAAKDARKARAVAAQIEPPRPPWTQSGPWSPCSIQPTDHPPPPPPRQRRGPPRR